MKPFLFSRTKWYGWIYEFGTIIGLALGVFSWRRWTWPHVAVLLTQHWPSWASKTAEYAGLTFWCVLCWALSGSFLTELMDEYDNWVCDRVFSEKEKGEMKILRDYSYDYHGPEDPEEDSARRIEEFRSEMERRYREKGL